VREKSRVE
jgi:hypothetical protein